MRNVAVRIALVAVLMAGIASACGSGSDDAGPSTSSTATTSGPVVPTTSRGTVSSTRPSGTPSSGSSAPVATSDPTTASTAALPAGAASAEAAATGLYAAWKNGDRAAAASFAAPAAIDTLFERPYTGPDLQFLGCDPDGDVFSCTYYYEGGARTFRTQGSAEAGFKVVEINDLAD